jgi:hypothetical protein
MMVTPSFDKDLVQGVVLGLALQDDGRIAQPGQHLGPLAAGVGFLDAAGQRALAAHRDASRHGGGAAAEQPGGDDQLVVGPEGVAGGRHFLGDDCRGHGATAKTGIITQGPAAGADPGQLQKPTRVVAGGGPRPAHLSQNRPELEAGPVLNYGFRLDR